MMKKQTALILITLMLFMSVLSQKVLTVNASPNLDRKSVDSNGAVDSIEMVESETAPGSIDSVSENQIWTGQIDGEMYFSFTPNETGLFYCDIDSSKLKDSYCFSGIDDETHKYFTFNTSNYLVAGTQYFFYISVRKEEVDENYEPLPGKGEVSFIIRNSTGDVKDLSSGNVSDLASEGEHLYKFHANKNGIYTFTSGVELEYTVLEVPDSNVEAVPLFSGIGTKRKFETKQGYEYYVICNCRLNNNKPFSVGVTEGKGIKNIKVLSFTPYLEEAVYSSVYSPYDLNSDFKLKIEITYVDETKETVEFYYYYDIYYGTPYESTNNNEYGLYIEYKGKTHSSQWMGTEINSGKQPVEISLFNGTNYVLSYDINVKKQIEMGYKELKMGTKVTELNKYRTDIWWIIRPEITGFYNLMIYDNIDLYDFYESYYYELFDSDDNVVEWNLGTGWKLIGGQTYAFHLDHGLAKSDSSYKFNYTIDLDRSHVHKFADWKTTKAATYTDEGISSRICTECGYEETKSIAKLVKPTEQQVVPSTPKIITLKKVSLSPVKNNKKKTIQVKWKSVSDATGYEVQYALNKKFTKSKKTKKASKTSLTVKKLKKGKTYYVRVRAYNKTNGNTVYGSWSAIKKVRIKK